MKNMLRVLKQKLNLVLIVVIGIAAGGITTAVVTAAEPDGSGHINACYLALTNTMSANVSGGTCPFGQTALSWDSGQPTVEDANGQVLGSLVSTDVENDAMQFYNFTLHRVIAITAINGTQFEIAGIDHYALFYESGDCSGTPHISDPIGTGAHTRLFRAGDSSYGIVTDATAATSVTVNSLATYDIDSDSFNCVPIDGGNTDDYYQLTTVSLPFTTPVAVPLQLMNP